MSQFYHLIDLRQGFKPQKDWAVFLDRDGVLIKEVHHLVDLRKLEFLPLAVEAVRMLNKRGIPVFLTTNQTVVARGLCREDFILKTHEKIKEKLARKGAFLDGIVYCPHSVEADVAKYRLDCDWRKPKEGMFEFIIDRYQFKAKKSYGIGDKARDILAYQKLGIKDILVLTGYAGKDLLYSAEPSVIKKDIMKAVKYILEQHE